MCLHGLAGSTASWDEVTRNDFFFGVLSLRRCPLSLFLYYAEMLPILKKNEAEFFDSATGYTSQYSVYEKTVRSARPLKCY